MGCPARWPHTFLHCSIGVRVCIALSCHSVILQQVHRKVQQEDTGQVRVQVPMLLKVPPGVSVVAMQVCTLKPCDTFAPHPFTDPIHPI